MHNISFTPTGVCSRKIDITVDGDTVKHVEFTGGCHGNAQAVARLVEGMKTEEVITRLTGINCRSRGTSCPDQLARALRTMNDK